MSRERASTTMRAHATISRSGLPHQPPVLDLHRERRAGDDGEKREERAERERGQARYSLADGAAEREHAAETHQRAADRKSTRLNSSHRCISYAVFCLKKKINP